MIALTDIDIISLGIGGGLFVLVYLAFFFFRKFKKKQNLVAIDDIIKEIEDSNQKMIEIHKTMQHMYSFFYAIKDKQDKGGQK